MLAPTCLLMSLQTAKQHRSDLRSYLAPADMSVQRSESSLPVQHDTRVRPDGGMAKWSQSFPLRRLGLRKPALSEPPRWISSASSIIQATSYLSLSGRVTSRPSSHGHTSSTNRLSVWGNCPRPSQGRATDHFGFLNDFIRKAKPLTKRGSNDRPATVAAATAAQ